MATMKGKILFINEPKAVTDKFTTQSFAIDSSFEVNGQMIEGYAGFQATNKKCALLDPLEIGDEVEVTYGVRASTKDKPEVQPTRRNPKSTECYTNLDMTTITLIKKADAPNPAVVVTSNVTPAAEAEGDAPPF